MTRRTQSSTHRKLKNSVRLGALIYALGMLFLASMEAGIKSVVETISISQIWLFRTTVSLIPLAIFILILEKKALRTALVTKHLSLQVLRGTFGAATFITVVLAIQNAELAAVAAFALTAPLVMLLIGVGVLGETVKWPILVSAVLGCAAAFVMVPTSSDITLLGAFFAFLSALFHALATVTARILARHDSGSTTALYTNLVALILSVAFFSMRGFELMLLKDVIMCIGVGIFGGASYLALAIAMKHLDVSRAAVLEYTFYLWAALFGVVYFAEIPSASQLICMAVIAICGISITRSDRTQ